MEPPTLQQRKRRRRRRKRRDWAHLPSELLEKIFTNFTEISDHVRFRAVCSSWRTNPYLRIPISLPPKFPWFVYTCTVPNNRTLAGGRHIICPSLSPSPSPSGNSTTVISSNNNSRRTLCISPNPSHMRVFGSSFGYLIYYHYGEAHYPVSLLNPFTGSHIQLPPPPFRFIRGTNIRGKLIKSPDHNGGPPFYCIFYNYLNLLSCHHRDSEWKWTHHTQLAPPLTMTYALENITYHDGTRTLQDFAYHDGTHELKDFAYHDGRLIVIRKEGDAPSTTSTIGSTVYFINVVPLNSRVYLVESPSSGKLLMVVARGGYGKLEVFQLNNVEQPKWCRVKSIGDDQVLFIDKYNAMCLAASDFEGCRGNCIYFWEGNKCISLFNIGDSTIEKVNEGVIGWEGAWVLPNP